MMKNFVVILILLVVSASCSEYQEVLNKGTIPEQYKLADSLYNAGKYNKSLMLFEKVTPAYKGKPQMQRIQFMVADANYRLKNYQLSSYYFNRFINNYPKSSKIEEANFLVSQSFYKASPRFSLDQKDTDKALTALQAYLDDYPNSKNAEIVNQQYQELIAKKEKKAYEIARQYYKTEKYKSAIKAFDIFIAEYLGSKYKEDALYYKFKAGYDLGIKSVESKKEQRLLDAKKYYNRFKKYYPNSNYIAESDDLATKIEKELEQIK